MAQTPNDPAKRERRLDEVLGEYLAAAAKGEGRDRPELLARHPELAAEQATFFADYDRLHRLAHPLRPVAQAAQATEPAPDPTDTPNDSPTGAGPAATLTAARLASDLTAELAVAGPSDSD
jgi:hypothetical protein